MSGFPLHPWSIFSLDTGFWVDSLFCQHLKNAMPLSSGLHGFWWKIYHPITWMSDSFLILPQVFEALFTFFLVWFFSVGQIAWFPLSCRHVYWLFSCYLYSAVEPITEFILLYFSVLKFPHDSSLYFLFLCWDFVFFICLKHVHDCFLKHLYDGHFKSLSDNSNIWFVFHVSVYWLSFLIPCN